MLFHMCVPLCSWHSLFLSFTVLLSSVAATTCASFFFSCEYFDPARFRLHGHLSSTEWGSPSALTPSQFDTARVGESGTGVIVPGG